MEDCWKPLMHGIVSLDAVGRFFFAFSFSRKEDRDLVFKYGPYFMGLRGLFLAPWTLDFNPRAEITAAPIWVRLPHLPLHIWGKGSLEDIGNKLGRFLDSVEPKGDQFTCARICVEVNLEKGLPEAIQLSLGEWCHIQELDYEQIPFKCLQCHVYGHFAKSCPKASQDAGLVKEDDFQPVTNRRRQPRRKEPLAQASKATHSAEATLENKNSFDVMQEDEAQEPKATAVKEDPPAGESLLDPTPPKIVVAASPSVPAAEGLVISEASPFDASPAVRLDARRSSSRSAGDPDSDSCSVPSPPLTRGRKTNKDWWEAKAHSNILSGVHKTMVPFLKGQPPNH